MNIKVNTIQAAFLASKYNKVEVITRGADGHTEYFFPDTAHIKKQLKEFETNSVWRDIRRGYEKLIESEIQFNKAMFGTQTESHTPATELNTFNFDNVDTSKLY